MSPEANKLVEDFDSSAGQYCWQMDQGHNESAINDAILNYNTDKEALLAYIQSLEDKLVVPEGFKIVPIEPTEEMIQTSCLAQSTVKYDSYEAWADGLSNGIVEMIRKFEDNSYRTMVGAYKHEV